MPCFVTSQLQGVITYHLFTHARGSSPWWSPSARARGLKAPQRDSCNCPTIPPNNVHCQTGHASLQCRVLQAQGAALLTCSQSEQHRTAQANTLAEEQSPRPALPSSAPHTPGPNPHMRIAYPPSKPQGGLRRERITSACVRACHHSSPRSCHTCLAIPRVMMHSHGRSSSYRKKCAINCASAVLPRAPPSQARPHPSFPVSPPPPLPSSQPHPHPNFHLPAPQDAMVDSRRALATTGMADTPAPLPPCPGPPCTDAAGPPSLSMRARCALSSSERRLASTCMCVELGFW